MNTLGLNDILSVSQLTRSIKNILESEYRFVRISGEISNLRTPFSGHSYFTLKDSSAQIRAVLFKQQRRFVDINLQDGQQVVLFGRITVYEPRGEYQIIADSVELFGTGVLQQKFEQLKLRLAEKGYFAQENKKPIPPYPARIVVISSPTGAALHDFLKIVKIRSSPIHIQILPVRVQGQEAAAEIAGALKIANALKEVDIIVLCRGGGSLEDLWAFNEERVAEAIHHSTLPIVTGIGHEIDFTIADFCADFRCPTPTGAAEKLVPDAHLLRRQLITLKSSLGSRLEQKLMSLEQRLQQSIRLLGDMKEIFRASALRLQLAKSYFFQAANKNLTARESTLHSCIRRLQRQAPFSRIELQEKHLQFLTWQLHGSIKRLLEKKQMVLARQAGLLHSVSPLATLGRGYSIVRKFNAAEQSYRIIRRSSEVGVGEEINILLSQGQLECIVEKVQCVTEGDTFVDQDSGLPKP